MRIEFGPSSREWMTGLEASRFSQLGRRVGADLGAHLYMPLLCINTRVLPKSLHKCIWDKPHHPKKTEYCRGAGVG